jgi:hypothetical protein
VTMVCLLLISSVRTANERDSLRVSRVLVLSIRMLEPNELF